MKYTYEDLDERIIKTRLALTGAILNLIKNEKKTKVLNICHEADITPMTYYHHFGNKQQLLVYAIRKQLEGTLPIPRKLKPINVKHLMYYLLVSLNNFVQKNKVLLYSAIKQSKEGGKNNSYIDLMFNLIQQLVKDEVKLLVDKNQYYIDFISTVICGGLKNMFLQMVQQQRFLDNQQLWTSFKSIFTKLN